MDENIVLYTIDCPRCKVLEEKLTAAGIRFVKVSDREELAKEGLLDANFPILKALGKMYSFKEAVELLREYTDDCAVIPQ